MAPVRRKCALALLQALALCSGVNAFANDRSVLLQGHRHSSKSDAANTKRPHAHATCSSSYVSLLAQASSSSSTPAAISLDVLADTMNSCIDNLKPEFIKNCKVRAGPSSITGGRLGLIATEAIGKDSVALSIPYDDQLVLTPDLAAKNVLEDVLPDGYDGWTGDVGLLAMLVLNEVARAGEQADTTATSSSGNSEELGIAQPKRKAECQSLINAWVKTLPSPAEMSSLHPLLWNEDEQEILQGSSTRKIYRILDDIDEDATWLSERVWSTDRTRFPERVVLNGEVRPCFTPDGFAWAVAIASSRSNFVDGSLRILPFMDLANHRDLGTEEVAGGTMGTFGTTRGAEIRTGQKYAAGEEVFVNYGPKSAAEYLLEHGFIPQQAKTTAVSELTFEIDPEDRFYDDKLDVLEFETYESAPMEPSQSFDVLYEPGRDGEPDPAIVQFLRLVKLGGKDAFLLESVFRKEVWGFMGLPVSQVNERDVVDEIANACSKALEEMGGIEETEEVKQQDEANENSPLGLCAIVREAERKALARTVEYMQREKEALDLKEYYQERRLKDLGLDSEWDPESADFGDDDELNYGQTRLPGGGDLDW